ncbi:LA2681 family HEPN domain-containing protein [Shewanella sp. SM20]|nr:LA2681 family HEPN domain-containing protein [Shewanella sp. SM20]
MEHCSLKIVDDFGNSLSKSDILFHQHYLDELIEKKSVLENQLTELYSELSKAKKERDVAAKASLEEEMLKLNKDLTKTDSAISDKEKRSNHSLLITDKKFEERLLDLMKLVRSSIVYLSLAINLDEKRKPKNGVIAMPMSVPLKSDQINIE